MKKFKKLYESYMYEFKTSEVEYTLTKNSSKSEKAEVKKLLQRTKNYDRKLGPLLADKSGAWDPIEKIEVHDNGYFYVHTKDGGVYDPGDVAYYPEMFLPSTPLKDIATILIKKWTWKDPKTGETYDLITKSRAESESKYGKKDLSTNIGELKVNGVIVGVVPDPINPRNVLKVLENYQKEKKVKSIL